MIQKVSEITSIEIVDPGTEFDEKKFKKVYQDVTTLLSNAKLSPLEATYLVANLSISVGKSIAPENKEFTHEDWVKSPSLDKAVVIAGKFILEVHAAIHYALQHGEWPAFDFFSYFGGKKDG
jgi:hypothetical protein